MVNTKSRILEVEDFQTPNPEVPMLFARPVVIAEGQLVAVPENVANINAM